MELRELQVIGKILELKSSILRDAVHFRFLRLGQVDAQMEELKKIGVLQAYIDKPLPDSAAESLAIKRTASKSRARRTIEDVDWDERQTRLNIGGGSPVSMKRKGYEAVSEEQILLFKKQMMHRQRIEDEIEALREDLRSLEDKSKKLALSVE